MKAAYLIHFDSPLHHANHYAGATNCLWHRMHQHATGKGSRLTAHLFKEGLPWSLALIWQPPWTVEKFLKKTKNVARYCPLCNAVPRIIKGVRTVFTDEINMPITNEEWKKWRRKRRPKER